MSSMLELPPALAEPFPAPVPEQAPAHLSLVPAVPLDFDDAVRRITPRLQRYARRRLGDEHEAEELVQEALLRAYKHGGQLRTEDDLIAWCTVVTGRLVIDRLRVRGRSTSVAEVPEGTRVGRDTADVVVARDEARMALDSLDAMPARQAAVLWAREVEGQGYDEIGLRFAMTEPAVRSILTRARKSLRKEYAARGGTLPVAGLVALAPWVTGLRWADRLRTATARLAAPAAIGAMALGLVGGALHSPLFQPEAQAPGGIRAVVSTPASQSLGRPYPALLRTTSPHTSSSSAKTRADVAPRVATLAEDGPLRVPCVGQPQDNDKAGAGNEACGTQHPTSSIYLSQSLPDNPTGVRDVGVESEWIDCSKVPTTPLATCQSEPSNGESR